ncbi:MAG: FMN-binding glutamate synthase family protein [Parvibaculales bacterium]
MGLAGQIADILTALLLSLFGLALVFLLLVYWRDRHQSRNAIYRNYPLIGHMRYLLQELGVFLRTYFFAADREELPFNRFQREFINDMADDHDGVVAFGSDYQLHADGAVRFANSFYPVLEEDVLHVKKVTFGPDTAHPYTTDSYLNISGMSYGALSSNAVLALSRGAKMAGAWHNTGEGGFSRFHEEGGADTVFQIGTANYGVRDADGNLDYDKLADVAANPQIVMFEIKLSQGAKPGKGGILPGAKVTKTIAETRGIAEGADSVSPNRRRDVANPQDLAALIARVKESTKKPVGIKFVLGRASDLDDMFAAFQAVDSYPSFITLDGADGGTGAAPAALMDHVGMTLEESLPALMAKLEQFGLREKILVCASGKLVTPALIAWALAEGAVSVNTARGPMFALGCIQSLQCDRNTCPTGITTHNKKKVRGLDPQLKSVRVANYLTNTKKQVGYIAHSTGANCARSMDKSRVYRYRIGDGLQGNKPAH